MVKFVTKPIVKDNKHIYSHTKAHFPINYQGR